MRHPMLSLVLSLALAAGPAMAQDGAVSPASETVAGFLDCVRDRGATLVTAHRGGVVGGLPENSMEAMAHTAAYIPTLIEVDVQRTRDGVLVLMHDDDVSRTTTGSGLVQQMSWDEVSGLVLTNNAGLATGARTPTLEQALEWARGRAILQLDIKRGVPLEDVAAAIRKADAQRHALVILYTVEDAALFARLDPTVSMNVNLASAEALAALVAAGVDLDRVTAFTGLEAPDPAYWALLKSKGVSVAFGMLWRSDMEIAATGDDARYARMAALGADVLVTDRHFEAYRALEAGQNTRAAVAACSTAPIR